MPDEEVVGFTQGALSWGRAVEEGFPEEVTLEMRLKDQGVFAGGRWETWAGLEEGGCLTPRLPQCRELATLSCAQNAHSSRNTLLLQGAWGQLDVTSWFSQPPRKYSLQERGAPAWRMTASAWLEHTGLSGLGLRKEPPQWCTLGTEKESGGSSRKSQPSPSTFRLTGQCLLWLTVANHLRAPTSIL